MAGLRLIIGLGNPGADYDRTRHNAGFWFLDALAESTSTRLGKDSKLHAEVGKTTIAGQSVWLLKPTTFMNRSGQSVASALAYYKIAPEEALIAHDDLDLPPGAARLKLDGGHGGQNGLRDIMAQLGHGRFHRLRLGIGHPGDKDMVTPWVLGRPGKEHELAIKDAVKRSLEQIELLVDGQFDKAMQTLHTPKPKA